LIAGYFILFCINSVNLSLSAQNNDLILTADLYL